MQSGITCTKVVHVIPDCCWLAMGSYELINATHSHTLERICVLQYKLKNQDLYSHYGVIASLEKNVQYIYIYMVEDLIHRRFTWRPVFASISLSFFVVLTESLLIQLYIVFPSPLLPHLKLHQQPPPLWNSNIFSFMSSTSSWNASWLSSVLTGWCLINICWGENEGL